MTMRVACTEPETFAVEWGVEDGLRPGVAFVGVEFRKSGVLGPLHSRSGLGARELRWRIDCAEGRSCCDRLGQRRDGNGDARGWVLHEQVRL